MISVGVKIDIIYIYLYIYIYLNPHLGQDFPLNNPCHPITESKPSVKNPASRKPSSSEASIAKEPPGETTGKAEIRSFYPKKKTIADWKT